MISVKKQAGSKNVFVVSRDDLDDPIEQWIYDGERYKDLSNHQYFRGIARNIDSTTKDLLAALLAFNFPKKYLPKELF